jgi:hypothetical protein
MSVTKTYEHLAYVDTYNLHEFLFRSHRSHRQSSDITGKSSNLAGMPELGSQGSARAPLDFQTHKVYFT